MRKWLVIVLVSAILVSCATVERQALERLGSADRGATVIGKASNVEFLGMSLMSDEYHEIYNKAIADAFLKSPSGTTRIVNLKGFTVRHADWPQFFGAAVVLGGASATLSDNVTSRIAGAFTIAYGLCITLIYKYDYVVEGQPVIQQ